MEIGLVQALILIQDIGLWSGNRRKMEIAECRKWWRGSLVFWDSG